MSNTKDSPVLYTEDTQTPTNINTTSQAPVTRGDDGVILDQYQDQNNQNQYASAPNTTTSTTNSATGSGLTAAEGTEYSWDTKAKERADLSYKSDVLEAKSNYLTNRQELENQGQQLQTQTAMNKYSQNQSNEKAGWTGGYILDTERQMNYLKQTIQSQMYGAMELQKYGYDTSLAAARLAYDTNKYDLALEYYNTALSRAVSEAEITGYYVSPETSEMLNEYSIASKILNDDTATEEEKLRADKVLATVYDWFEANGISKEGRITSAQLLQEMSISKQVFENYGMDITDQKTYTIDKDSAFKLDANGNWTLNKDGTAETFRWDNMSADEILEYIKTSDIARDQYYSRLDKTAYELENSFTEWCTSNGYANKDSEGNITGFNKDDYSNLFMNYLASNGDNLLQSELDKFKDSNKTDINNLLNNWECSIKLPDGSTAKVSLVPETGIKVGDKVISNTETVNDYQGYIMTEGEGDNKKTYIKDCEDLNTLMEVLNNNPSINIGVLTSDPTLPDHSKITSDYVTYILGPVVLMGWDLISDLTIDPSMSQYQKEQVRLLTGTIKATEELLGENNLKLLQDAKTAYDSMSERDRASLSEQDLANYKKAEAIISGLNTYKDALHNAQMRDANIWQDPWEYIGNNYARDMENIWNDGYQIFDVTRTVTTAVVDTAETVVACVVGGAKWLWDISIGSIFKKKKK